MEELSLDNVDGSAELAVRWICRLRLQLKWGCSASSSLDKRAIDIVQPDDLERRLYRVPQNRPLCAGQQPALYAACFSSAVSLAANAHFLAS